ncbi:hypothetical protein A2U01_0061732, partial [Trifolium medium]|nr:hypothetical protein [Trifolium medium]
MIGKLLKKSETGYLAGREMSRWASTVPEGFSLQPSSF